MKYLYKLLDKRAKDDLILNHRISLSRPIYEFKSEIKGYEYIKYLNKKIDAGDPDLIEFTPSDFEKTHDFMQMYWESLSPEDKEQYSFDYDIKSDLQLLFTVDLELYCGYFTKTDLKNDIVRAKYIKNNASLCSDKCAYVKVPIQANSLDKLFWLAPDCEHTFVCDANQSYPPRHSYRGIRGELHLGAVDYVPSESLSNRFILFNGKDGRIVHSLLGNIKSHYRDQNEIRLFLRLPSIEPNQSITGFSNMYTSKQCSSPEECVFYFMLSVCRHARKFPRYIYLQISDFECKDI